ncbi:MAG: hypothetical protein ACKVH8_05235 [Pirellulales bacterium]
MNQSDQHVIICPLCASRIMALTKDIGRDIKCPDCYKVFLVSKATPKFDKPRKLDLNDEDPYALKEADSSAEEAIKDIGRQAFANAEKQAQADAQRHEISQTKQNAFKELEGQTPNKARESLTPEDYDPREFLVEYPLKFTSASIQQDIRFYMDSAVSIRIGFMVLGLSLTMYVILRSLLCKLSAAQFWNAIHESDAFGDYDASFGFGDYLHR